MRTMKQTADSGILNPFQVDPANNPTPRDRFVYEAMARAVDALERIADALEAQNGGQS
ncbi:hypothetical protein [Bifidobacterium leontopitheci]|uniref:Uncharacterized protein n=1 Tax=Bifidobacterium leontopitheci TaxID=2650774 RepID=A0A6I1GQZ8_9BIFI|nr:hypothetical protein [Bifidobacterium leontopitheci]KAB7790558.1 hypothetical protein F7D09_0927 [Bifidobacterium leontopitheci]